jgi:hypothetical protein
MRYLVSFRVFDITPQGKCKATSFAKSFCPNQSAFAGVVWMRYMHLVLPDCHNQQF